MLVFFYVRQDVDFVNGALFQLLILFKASHFNNFDCILLVVQFVDSSEDLAVCPFTNDLKKSVVLDNSNHDIKIL